MAYQCSGLLGDRRRPALLRLLPPLSQCPWFLTSHHRRRLTGRPPFYPPTHPHHHHLPTQTPHTHTHTLGCRPDPACGQGAGPHRQVPVSPGQRRHRHGLPEGAAGAAAGRAGGHPAARHAACRWVLAGAARRAQGFWWVLAGVIRSFQWFAGGCLCAREQSGSMRVGAGGRRRAFVAGQESNSWRAGAPTALRQQATSCTALPVHRP